ncbi:MAG: DeoR/GlpR transcriptional regulator, partial [Clostridiales bacterium]|nr:DeoR/GlpR transcriptional regulator [Clostridiales bacterium]
EFHVDLAVCSCKGIDLSMGVTDSNEKDAQIKQANFQAAKKRVLAVDDTKFDKISFTRICDLSSLDLVVTNCRPQAKGAEKLKELGADVLY